MPYLFEASCSREEFEGVVSGYLDVVIEKVMQEKHSIGGCDIIDQLVTLLTEHGYKLIKPDSVINLHGECFYSKDFPRPEAMSDVTWRKVLAHNKKMYEILFGYTEEGEEEEPK